MLTAIKLQPNMQCEYICQQIQLALSRYQRDNGDMNDTILIIDIKKTINDESFIPKLEHNIIHP